MAAAREYLSSLPLRIPPVVRQRAQRALELGLIEPDRYLQAALSLEPAIDVMQDEDLRMRIATIGVLAERGTVEAVRLLSQMTHDPDDHVRTHAAQALEVIDTRWLEFARTRQAHAAESDSPHAWADVARAQMTLAQMKAGAPVLRDVHLQHALNALERALRQEERAEWLRLRAEIELQADLDDAAVATLQRALALQPDEPDALLLLAKLAYRRGDYAEVRSWCRTLAALPTLSPEAADLAAFWTEPTSAVGA